MLNGKKILLGITGSIAAYKSISLLRLLIKAGAEVQVLTTPAAKDFVPTLVLSTLSKREVLTDMFNHSSWSNHVMLGRWADVFLVAPLSCNTLAKMASGICDNLFMAVYLSNTCPVIGVPAMDEDMWKHPATKANLEKIRSYGNAVMPVNHGELASGLIGEGRMAEPEAIFDYVHSFFAQQQQLKGKKIVVTAGPTYERLDPVRYIGNYSSGKMGFAIAEELSARGAKVTLISGPTHCTASSGITRIDVVSAAEMHDAAIKAFADADACIMSAAVADYTPATPSKTKIKKLEDEDHTSLRLNKTTDILKALGGMKQVGQILVGFALETDNEQANAQQKLKTKNADLIVLNSLQDEGAGFGGDTNNITIFDKNGVVFRSGLKSKAAVARDIVDVAVKYL